MPWLSRPKPNLKLSPVFKFCVGDFDPVGCCQKPSAKSQKPKAKRQGPRTKDLATRSEKERQAHPLAADHVACAPVRDQWGTDGAGPAAVFMLSRARGPAAWLAQGPGSSAG